MTSTILIIGSPGRLRDALRVILHSLVHSAEIVTATDFETGYAAAAKKQPAIVIVDGSEYLDSDCRLLKQLLSQQKSSRCLVIADTLQRAMSARQYGADGVILQGFTIKSLQQTLLSLDVLPKGANDHLPASIKPKPTAVPLAQRS